MNLVSLEDHLARFLEGLRLLNASPGTIRTRLDGLKRFFRYLRGMGIEDVREVTRSMVEGYLLEAVRAGGTYCSRVTYLQTLKRFFGYLEETDVILVDPCSELRHPQRESRLPRHVLTREQTFRILGLPDVREAKGIRDRAILEMLYSTGIRCEEIASLSVYDVDTNGGSVRIVHGTGGKERVVPMGETASEYVRAYMEVRKRWGLKNKEERALWLSAFEPHRAIKKQAIAVTVKNYLREAGVAEGRVHMWRHTCATHLVANGANVAYVQRILGHSSLNTTQIYTRVAVPEVQAMHLLKHPRSKKRG